VIEPYYDCDGITIYNADCREVLPSIDAGSINLICTDPPYFKVKNEWWDRQWDKPEQFLNWIGGLCETWQRVLAFNGSLYVFASPQMAWGVEGEVRQWFNVLNRIAWRKPYSRHNQADKASLRGYFPQTESIIFAEQNNSDSEAVGVSGYRKKCDEAARDVFGKYITNVRNKNNLTMKELTAAVGAHGAVNHGGACSNWEAGLNVPTRDHYDKLQAEFAGCFDREYEDLRREYEDLRRPFSATKERPYTDVWEYSTVKPYKGKHPCEKPKQMMDHIVLTSSREGDTVLDCFGGSMRLAESCKEYGRKFVGIEVNEEYCEAAADRLAQGVLF